LARPEVADLQLVGLKLIFLIVSRAVSLLGYGSGSKP
jgi:hypothetical protein